MKTATGTGRDSPPRFRLDMLARNRQAHNLHRMAKVTYQKSGVEAEWSEDAESLLELAEANGLDLDFGCREGNCTACQQTLVSGEIEYPHGHNGIPDEGNILLCCSQPRDGSDVVIDA